MQKPLRKTFKTIMNILDRAPSGSRGQSLMELSITTPIFLIMLLGLVEVGWAANNYLTLLDVSREAGRFASVRDPIDNWTEGLELGYQRMDCDDKEATFNTTGETDIETYPGPDLSAFGYSMGVEGPLLYFDSVACTVIVQLPPVEFKDDKDDIVISVISYAVVNESGVRRARVTGRYPSGSNECSDDARDPFAPPWLPTADRDPLRYDTGQDNRRGYAFRGNHRTATGCLGSEFSLSQIEDLLNRTMLDDSGNVVSEDEIKEIPNNAFVLVEIFWEHEQLLGLPFFTWIGNPIDMSVWTFFPVTAAEPTATAAP